MVTVTCFGGACEVGGNQVLLEDGPVRLFFDFGTPYTRRNRYYEEFLTPRTGYGLLDYLEMGLLPPRRGLYRPDLLHPLAQERLRDLPPLEVEGVLLSHAHLDHSGSIPFLREEVPIYATALTAFIAKAIQDTGRGGLEGEVVYTVPRETSPEGVLTPRRSGEARQRLFLLPDRDRVGEGALRFWWESPSTRPLDSCPPGKAERAEGLPVRAFPVDHSIPGACAWAVETSVGWVVFTGDLRRHGTRRDWTETFIEEASRLRPRALLCEGTRAGEERPSPSVGEEEVFERCLEAVGEARGHLIIADFGPRHIERLQSFYRIARETGRFLVVLPRDAYLLDALRPLDPSIPRVGEGSGVLVYAEARGRRDRWEQRVLETYGKSLISPLEASRRQEDLILCFSFYDLNEFPTLQPRPGSLYLYSSPEAFDEEQAFDFRRLLNWLDHYGVRPLGVPRPRPDGLPQVPEEERGYHSSGHASGEELVEMVLRIRPQVLIPVHCTPEGHRFFRERLEGTDIRVIAPEYAKPIPL